MDLKTSSEKALPLEKSKPRVDPPNEPIGDGYCLDPEKTPKKMIGTDQQISGEKGRSPESLLAWVEVGWEPSQMVHANDTPRNASNAFFETAFDY